MTKYLGKKPVCKLHRMGNKESWNSIEYSVKIPSSIWDFPRLHISLSNSLKIHSPPYYHLQWHFHPVHWACFHSNRTIIVKIMLKMFHFFFNFTKKLFRISFLEQFQPNTFRQFILLLIFVFLKMAGFFFNSKLRVAMVIISLYRRFKFSSNHG